MARSAAAALVLVVALLAQLGSADFVVTRHYSAAGCDASSLRKTEYEYLDIGCMLTPCGPMSFKEVACVSAVPEAPVNTFSWVETQSGGFPCEGDVLKVTQYPVGQCVLDMTDPVPSYAIATCDTNMGTYSFKFGCDATCETCTGVPQPSGPVGSVHCSRFGLNEAYGLCTPPAELSEPTSDVVYSVFAVFIDDNCNDAGFVWSQAQATVEALCVPELCTVSTVFPGYHVNTTCTKDFPGLVPQTGALTQVTTSGDDCSTIISATQYATRGCFSMNGAGGNEMFSAVCNATDFVLINQCQWNCDDCDSFQRGAIGQAACSSEGDYYLCTAPWSPPPPTASPPTTAPPTTAPPTTAPPTTAPPTTEPPTTAPPTTGPPTMPPTIQYQTYYQYSDSSCSEASLELVTIQSGACAPAAECIEDVIPGRYIRSQCLNDLPELRQGWVMQVSSSGDSCSQVAFAMQLPIGACVPYITGNYEGNCDGSIWSLKEFCDAGCGSCSITLQGAVGEANCEDGLYGVCNLPAAECSAPTPVYTTPLDEVWQLGGIELDNNVSVSLTKDCLAASDSTVFGGWTVTHDSHQVRTAALFDRHTKRVLVTIQHVRL